MYLLRVSFSIADFSILLAMAIILAIVIYYVVASRRRLKKLIEESKRQASLSGISSHHYEEPLKPKWIEKKKMVPATIPVPLASMRSSKPSSTATDVATMPDGLHDLKQTIRQQQKTLNQLLTRVDKLDAQQETDVSRSDRWNLEEKETELQKTKEQLSAAQQVAGRVTQVYQEFDQMQQKLAELEESAAKTAALTSELEEMQEAYEQLQHDLAEKEETVQETIKKNRDLQQQLEETEDKLTEAALQRQHLHKRVQLLEDMNAELQHMSEANKKMKTELRRIAELESLLSLVSDERDLLLKKRIS